MFLGNEQLIFGGMRMPDGATTPAPAPAPAPAPMPVPAPGAVWHAGVDAETLGTWQNKGWDITDPAKLATAATKAYGEATRFIGAPPDKIARIPEANDEAGYRALWTRLGAPDKAEGYDFSAIKFADGTALDEGFVTNMRDAALKHGLTKDAASAVVATFVKQLEGAEASETAEKAAALETAKAKLAANWGANAEANLFVAKQAAKALGVTAEEVAALEAVVGYDRVMEMFRTVGTKIGEDKFVAGERPAGNGVMTREQATARKAELMKDTVWRDRYMNGGSAESREMTALNTLIVGDDTQYSRSR
jgi:hypothetical protein